MQKIQFENLKNDNKTPKEFPIAIRYIQGFNVTSPSKRRTAIKIRRGFGKEPWMNCLNYKLDETSINEDFQSTVDFISELNAKEDQSRKKYTWENIERIKIYNYLRKLSSIPDRKIDSNSFSRWLDDQSENILMTRKK